MDTSVTVPATNSEASVNLEVSTKSSLSRNNPDVKSNIQFSSPVASIDTDAESDVKIKSNKAKNYYDRYSNTAKKDIGKILGMLMNGNTNKFVK